jgi:hypothetical protein
VVEEEEEDEDDENDGSVFKECIKGGIAVKKDG